MIVDRRVFNVKPGRTDEVVALLKEAIEGNKSYTHPYRIYVPSRGPHDVVAVEWEYESLAEDEESWAEWFAGPEVAEFGKKWYELIERGGGIELWAIAEQRT